MDTGLRPVRVLESVSVGSHTPNGLPFCAMMRFRAVSRAHGALGRARGLCLVASASAAAAIKADPTVVSAKVAPVLGSLVGWSQPQSWWLSPSLLGLGALFGAAQRGIGDPSKWRVVHHVLDMYQEHVFGDENGELHEHRITLFKHVRWRLSLRGVPWSGWLVPVERSGHTTHRSVTYFRAPDEADNAEGVAGIAWNSSRAVEVELLPDLNALGCTEEHCEDYAKRTRSDLAKVKVKRFRARSYYAVPVEVKGERWGALVIDSRSSTLKKKKIREQQHFVLSFLSKTLEGL